MKITKKELYKRQTTLAEIGDLGQKKLVQSNVVIVGCGGLGGVAAVYLAASGVGVIHLVDYDVVDVSNLHRQVFYTPADVGKPKVEVLANHIRSMTPFVAVPVSNMMVKKNNVIKMLSKADYVLDCTDSLPVKYLLNDACILLDKPLIYGSLYKYDGYVASFNIKDKKGAFSSNLRDAFPEISKEAIPNCSEIGTLNTIVGIIGLLQANEVLKLITGIGKPLINELLIYNSLENSQYKMKLKPRDTSYTERKQRIAKLFERETYFDATNEVQDEALLISAEVLRKKLSFGEATLGLNIISVIEDMKIQVPFHVHKKIPLSQLNVEALNFNEANEYVIVCNKGVSSYIAMQKIKEVHPDLKVLSLKNGITNY
tara:strand:- start:94798 stop:95910 length:1113 start_codon:yes stop_codon:yes gene_type:complete